ncbi:hypothetical protein [Gordonia sp. NB41Y]|uniref:hypothetical protein n=1 Tax=Gordonia sp. NB41Y TaxID=875808 RepID=UPI00034D1219|nr:hypothetical protein [Gordonia sp. NB41Y]WLP91342.1 hypothetical protein Q9K23_03460 [Gordonia sp. NB41Y]
MRDRHLSLVPPLPQATAASDYATQAATALGAATDYVRRRGGTVEIAITDIDGVELVTDAASSDLPAFVVRAEAHFRTAHSETVIVGVAEPVERDQFLSDDTQYLSAQAEAVYDLVTQLRPHPSEVRL